MPCSTTPHSIVKKAPISYANHPAVPNPMTNSRADEILSAASLHLGRADFSTDVACCAGMQRSGNAGSFGSPGDGLDVIDDEAEFYAVINHTAGRVKIVRLINYCAGSAPGSNMLGCSWIAGNGIVLVRSGSVEDEGALWAHEFGHNAGLGHNPDSNYIMHACQCGGNRGLTQAECGKFWTPASGTQIAMISVGACTDVDTDEVQDLIDNCPVIGNNDQRDSDDDGVGDACDALPVTTPTPTRTPTASVTPTADPNFDAVGHPDANPDGDVERDTDPDGDTHQHADAHAHDDYEQHIDADADSYPDPDAHPVADRDTDSHARHRPARLLERLPAPWNRRSPTAMAMETSSRSPTPCWRCAGPSDSPATR